MYGDTLRKVTLPVLMENVHMLTLLHLDQSFCVGLCRLSVLIVIVDVKNVWLIPLVMFPDFMVCLMTF